MSEARRDLLLQLLPGCDLPGELVTWLRCGLEVQQAGGDLLAALDLEGADMDRRDDLLRDIIRLTPAGSRTARCELVSDCLYGLRQHPRKDLQRLIQRLQAMGAPRSAKQLMRIANRRRQRGSVSSMGSAPTPMPVLRTRSPSSTARPKRPASSSISRPAS